MAVDKEREISSFDRIKRIIGILRLDGREVEIHLPHSIESGRVAETAADTFRIRLSDPTVDINKQDLEFLHLSFIFSGEELFGRCPVTERANPYLTVGYPESFKTRTKRRYPRIRPPIPLKAKLKYKRFPQRVPGRVSPKDLPVKYSKLYWEAQRESVDIKKLFVLVGGELKKICPHSGIRIYNDQTVITRDAEVMRKSGKVLFIADCGRVESYTRFIPSEKITNYSFLLEERKNAGATEEEVEKELEKIMQDDRREGCLSKVLVPIFSKDEVIGHLKAFSDKKGKNISYEQVADLMALGLILRIGIEHAPLVPSFDDSIDTDLLNISEGGLFLQISSGMGTISIPEGADAQIRFFAGDKEIVLIGTVCRKSTGEQSYAIKFTKIADEQKISLKGFIDENIEKLSENK
ncbi:MAG: PilZ domain-containing protein [Spirochaetes bacterium]|nr:PilZ domain-containing protein [Spirochaetota bacterium]